VRKVLWAAGAYVIFFGALAVWRWHVWSYGQDTGGFTQMILNTFHGFYNRMESRSHFGSHWSPILATLLPLVAVTRSGLSLQLVQVVLAASSAIPLYLILKPRAGDALAFRCALLALLYPPLIGVAASDFHEIAFLPAVALWLAWAADNARWGWLAFFTLTAVMIREDVCLFLSVIGLGLLVYAALVRRAREAWIGAALALPAVLILSLYFEVLAPRFGGWPFGEFYQYTFAHGPAALAATIVLHPFTGLAAIVTLGRLTYALEALAPLAFLPLASWWSLTALPAFAVVTLASYSGVWRMGEHYAALWIPGVLLGACMALARVNERHGQKAALRWSTAALAVSILMLLAFSPVHPMYAIRAPYADRENARRAMACVPLAASVSTHEQWYSQFAGHYAAISPNLDPASEYLVYGMDFNNPVFAQKTLPVLRSLVATKRYVVICRFGNVMAYRRAERR